MFEQTDGVCTACACHAIEAPVVPGLRATSPRVAS